MVPGRNVVKAMRDGLTPGQAVEAPELANAELRKQLQLEADQQRETERSRLEAAE